jgi:hypothetical protein
MSIDTNFQQGFAAAAILLAQQKKSRLAGTVMTKSTNSKFEHFDRIGTASATLITSRMQDTPDGTMTHSRRRAVLEDYVAVADLDRVDLNKMAYDPSAAYSQTITGALGRKMDEIIIAAAEGNARSIDNADASSNVALTHTIDEDYNTGNSDIIVEKVVEARRIMMTNEVDPEEEKYFVLDSIALHNLLKETEVSSADYNTVKALAHGSINTFMGFNFIQSERLSTTSESFKRCLAYTKSGIGLALADALSVEVAIRGDKLNNKQLIGRLGLGAVRIEESKVIAVEAYRT